MVSLKSGQPFNNTDFLKFSSVITGVVVGVKHGVVLSLQIQHENRLQCCGDARCCVRKRAATGGTKAQRGEAEEGKDKKAKQRKMESRFR